MLYTPSLLSFECWPRLPIVLAPTPLQDARGLRAALGADAPRIIIKRDDLTGLALGGNKARKLEYLLADARQQKAEMLITCGAAQSNHALQTAAAARRFGFGVRCVLYGSPHFPKEATGNLVLHAWLETSLRWVQTEGIETRADQALRRAMLEEEALAAHAGTPAYCIPTGGSTPIGALGYVRAIRELNDQLNDLNIGPVSTLFFASGSGGTHAGMAVGAKRLNWPIRIVGVEIEPMPPSPGGVSPYLQAVRRLTLETSALVPGEHGDTEFDIELCPEYSGPAYGESDERTNEAIRLLASTEGIFVDQVYTGKALAALVDWVRKGRFSRSETILFWHTGGVAGLFANH